MKKQTGLIVGILYIVFNATVAHAVSAILPDEDLACYREPLECSTPAANCSLLCNTCKSHTASNTVGIDVTTDKYVKATCTDATTFSCQCITDSITYACSSGYYGTATSASSGCTACPDNATCAGGNGSTFICNSGYFKSSANPTVCTACPDNATCAFGSISCNAGYYLDSGVCLQCPMYELYNSAMQMTKLVRGDSAAGSTSNTDCYIPSDTEFLDNAGIGTYSADCHYSNIDRI